MAWVWTDELAELLGHDETIGDDVLTRWSARPIALRTNDHETPSEIARHLRNVLGDKKLETSEGR